MISLSLLTPSILFKIMSPPAPPMVGAAISGYWNSTSGQGGIPGLDEIFTLFTSTGC